MQLDKVVNFHKAMSDPTRMRMLILLAEGELNGQLLADKLGVTPATVTHHTAKLRLVGLIHERRDKNNVFLSLNESFLRSSSTAVIDLVFRPDKKKGEEEVKETAHSRLQESVLKNFFTSDGKLKHVPVQLKKKLIVLEELVSKLERGRQYSEKEINTFIKEFHEDFATIRREFIMHQFMFRDNAVYELNPRELWTNWQALS